MRLADWLKANKVTHEKFAERIATDRSSVSRYAAGRMPRRAHLQAIIRETGGEVTANDFVAAPDGDVAAA